MKAVVITGAAGFLGFHLAEHYLKNGFAVIGLDNFCTGSRENPDFLQSHYPDFSFLQMDACDSWTAIDSLISDKHLQIKFVFHLASPASPEHYIRLALETIRVNTAGLLTALEFAHRHNARLVFSSTSEVYGDPEVSPQPESYWGNVNSFGERSCYDEAKRCGEALLYSFNRKFGAKHGLVRIFNTYGPRMNPADGRVVINFLQQALQNTELSIYGDGSQTRSFCYVSDLVDGMVRYANTDLCIPVNLGMDQEFTIIELAEIVKKVTGSTSPLKYYPLPADDPRRRKPDLSRARQSVPNWRPTVGLEEGIASMMKWIKARPL
jgi:nucleoside-diphosphate-sugar epimerase